MLNDIQLPDLSQTTDDMKQLISHVLQLRKELELHHIMMMKNNPDKMYEVLKLILDEKYEQLQQQIKDTTHHDISK